MTILKPTDAESFMVAAKDYLSGLKAFDENHNQHLRSYSLIAGNALENALKAFLSAKGMDRSELKHIGHDLRALWKRSYDLGLPIEQQVPPHVGVLADGHWRPDFPGSQAYSIRYPLGIHGQSFPNYADIVKRIDEVISRAEVVVSDYATKKHSAST